MVTAQRSLPDDAGKPHERNFVFASLSVRMAKNPRVAKALIAGKYNGVDIETPEFAFGTDNKTPAFLAKNPLGQVPVLDTPEGSLWESNAIARYVARQGKASIYGKNTFEAAQIDQWIDFAANNIDGARSAWLFPIFGIVPFDHIAQVATQKAKETLKVVMRVLNSHLLNRTFLVGERITLADIVVSMSLYSLYTMVFDTKFRGEFHNVNRWFQTLVNQANFHAVLGTVTLCDQARVATPTPEAAKSGKGDKPKAEQKPKEKNPLDTLPPSKFSLDEWKRLYLSSDTKTVAIPWFWQNYDDSGFSLWKVEYKYNDDFSKLFPIVGMINGWFQRLEKLRNYAFGSILIHGSESANFSVSGVWLFRGLEQPVDLLECDDSINYTWTKLDAKDAATKTLIEEYFAWEGDFGGKGKPVEGKTFK